MARRRGHLPRLTIYQRRSHVYRQRAQRGDTRALDRSKVIERQSETCATDIKGGLIVNTQQAFNRIVVKRANQAAASDSSKLDFGLFVNRTVLARAIRASRCELSEFRRNTFSQVAS